MLARSSSVHPGGSGSFPAGNNGATRGKGPFDMVLKPQRIYRKSPGRVSVGLADSDLDEQEEVEGRLRKILAAASSSVILAT